MKIKRNTKKYNDFSLQNLTVGKLLAIHKALEESQKNGTLSIVGQDVLDTFNNQRSDFING